MSTARLTQVLTAIDTANAADPNLEDGRPAALLYGERMSEESWPASAPMRAKPCRSPPAASMWSAGNWRAANSPRAAPDTSPGAKRRACSTQRWPRR